MADLIDRQAAIDEVRQAYENDEMFDGYEYRLEELPSVQPDHIADDKRKIAELHKMVNYLLSRLEQRWILCSERMPECEQEVLICTKKKFYISKNSGFEWYEEPIITPALYEDGTMLEVNSKWRWEDIDYAGWDEEEDCGIIPEGWWENRHFNPDDVYNNPVDKEVIAWMPLPEPYREDGEVDE